MSLLAIIVLAIIAFVVLVGSLDKLVEEAVEQVGTETTKSEVALDSAAISLSDAQGALNGLSIANPAGFSDKKAISIGKISLKLDPNSLTTDTIVIKEIAINSPAINYELGDKGNNFDAIKKNVQGSGSASSESSGDESAVKLIIENLYIRDGSVAVSSSALGGKEISTKLPTIHLKDIGKESGGASPAEVAEKILTSLTNGVGSTVGKLDLSQLKGVGSAIQEQAGGATDKLKEGLGDTGDKLKGLFK
ncbi:AsmA family protein [Candidatus Reidiella endopervernicosa]|uniref:DUF748 domain-containing protein n=1 Tax=Candidatus Reidiella endopervernicosa TaxID=2738883 RepID=UPI0022A9B142|nr:AsmA family protein [Candidatus Reidiella endopervernicosa]